MKNVVKRVLLGIRRHPTRTATYVLAAYGVIWAIIEPASAFLSLQLQGEGRYLTMVVGSIAFGLWKALPPSHVRFGVKTTNTAIDISFGDLFKANGWKVIPANEFFDSALGDHVSPKSIHGQLLRNYFGGHPASFDALIDQGLLGIASKQVQRPSGRLNQYAIGTTAAIPINNDRFLVFALCTTDVDNLKASADVPQLWRALEGLWDKATIVVGGDTLTLPLIGGGLSGIGLPAAQLLQLLILSIVAHSKRRYITGEIHIVLPDNCFEEIDLMPIKEQWS